MARKTPSRLELRKQVEAAESKGAGADGKKKKKEKEKEPTAKKKTTRRTKTKASERKRLMWGVYNSNMKEEARFPYDQRSAAEERMEQLKARSAKKLFFIQAIKETITEPLPVAAEK